MSSGFQLYNNNGTPRILGTTTILRLVETLKFPIFPGVLETTYYIPGFNTDLGMFTWSGQYLATGAPQIAGQWSRAYDTMTFNNTTKIFTVKHISTSVPANSQSSWFQVLFLHYK